MSDLHLFLQPAAPSASAPGDSSTSFHPVEGGGEQRSGSTLLVEAYVVLWVILMGWILFLWIKQNGLTSRLDELEKAIDAADAKASTGTTGKKT
jgi:hypothetical protein